MAQIRNKYQVQISGLNMHHMIAFLENSQFEIENLSRINNSTIEFIISKKYLKLLKKTDIVKKYKLTTTKSHGPLTLFKIVYNKLGLILGIILCLSFMINSFSTISNVVIDQLNHSCTNGKNCIFTSENQEKLKLVLKQQGIEVGSKINKIPSNKKLEQVLMSEFEQISGVTLSTRGPIVNIKIVEGHLKHIFSENLISPVNGIILSCQSTSGILKVKPGDLVTQNQLLVEKEQNKEICATIQMRTFYHDSYIYDSEQYHYVRTGKQQNLSSFTIFKKTFTNTKSSKYKLYETETKNNYVFLNLFCPISLQTTTYYELEVIKNSVPFKEVEQSLKENLYAKTLDLLLNGAIEKQHSFITFTEGTRTRLDCYIEAIIEIKK